MWYVGCWWWRKDGEDSGRQCPSLPAEAPVWGQQDQGLGEGCGLWDEGPTPPQRPPRGIPTRVPMEEECSGGGEPLSTGGRAGARTRRVPMHCLTVPRWPSRSASGGQAQLGTSLLRNGLSPDGWPAWQVPTRQVLSVCVDHYSNLNLIYFLKFDPE